MESNKIRQAFLDFFESKEHAIVPSAPMVVMPCFCSASAAAEKLPRSTAASRASYFFISKTVTAFFYKKSG